jgi:hypothetical protein
LSRRITGEPNFNLSRFDAWFARQKPSIEEAERAWWTEQEKKGFAVDAAEFAPYDRKLEEILR